MTEDGKQLVPKLACWLLHRMSEYNQSYASVGDFEEEFHRILVQNGRIKALAWYWGQVITSLPCYLGVVIYWRLTMIRNYFKLTWRNIQKHRVFSIINIFGLAAGLACCMLIFLWVHDELQYDKFHEHGDLIYRTWGETEYADGRREVFTGSFYPLARTINETCPEVQKAVRFTTRGNVLLSYGDKKISRVTAGYADASFFSVFTFPFIAGDAYEALNDRFSMVISEETAYRIFGTTDAIGLTLNVNSQYDVKVTGIMKNVPRRASSRFDVVLPFLLSLGPNAVEPEQWGGNPFTTFVKLRANQNVTDVSQKITQVVLEKVQLPPEIRAAIHLQPLADMHLHNADGGGLITSIQTFSIIALFVLMVACINFMNLSTARATSRFVEVGLRKVVGAQRSDLIRQFFSESIFLSLFTFIIATGFVVLALPAFNQVIQKKFTVSDLMDWQVASGFITITLVAGILSGIYPALHLSSFLPAKVLRGPLRTGEKGVTFRKVLVVGQFTLSIFLIIGTIALYQQLHFIRTKDLGFNKKYLVCIRLNRELRNQYDAIKSELLRDPSIASVTRSLQHPSNIGSTVQALDWDGKRADEQVIMNFEYVDIDYFKTFQMEILDGRPFSSEFSTDLEEGYIVNEEAVKLMGMESPVGKNLSVFRKEGKIIGVVKNFHFQPLNFAITPFVIGADPEWSKPWMFLRVHPDREVEAVSTTTEVLKRFDPNYSGQAEFFEDIMMNWHYEAEQRMSVTGTYFSFLAILISSLGLLGLASFMAAQRTKEIGIRKVFGASAAGMVVMLSKDFTKWVLVSNFFAWPLAYFTMQRILDKYVYRISLGVEIFILAGLAALCIAWATVGYHALRAAWANPIRSLRYE